MVILGGEKAARVRLDVSQLEISLLFFILYFFIFFMV